MAESLEVKERNLDSKIETENISVKIAGWIFNLRFGKCMLGKQTLY